MQLFLTDARVPELAPLPPSVRQLVRHQALALMRPHSRLIACLPVILSVCGGSLGSFGGAFLTAWLQPGRHFETRFETMMICNLVGVIGGFGGGWIGIQLRLRKLRPYLSQCVGDYVARIQRAN